MRKREPRGLQLLCARNDHGNFVAMAIDQDPESAQFGDAIYAYLDRRGNPIRRADVGEFLFTSINCDDVQLRVFPYITQWSWPMWEIFAFKIEENVATYWLARKTLGCAQKQYGRLETHKSPQSSGQPVPKQDYLLFNRIITDVVGGFGYTQHCKEGYSIDTVLESLPSFTPISYFGWMADLSKQRAEPWLRLGKNQAHPYYGTAVPTPPAMSNHSASTWQAAVEQVIGQKLNRPYTHIEMTKVAYLEIWEVLRMDMSQEREQVRRIE